MLQTLIEELPPAFFDTPAGLHLRGQLPLPGLCSVLSRSYRSRTERRTDDLGSDPTLPSRSTFANHVADEEAGTVSTPSRADAQVAMVSNTYQADLRFATDNRLGREWSMGSRGSGKPERGCTTLVASRAAGEVRRRRSEDASQCENADFFPLARQRLSQSDLALLGRAMRSRRLPAPPMPTEAPDDSDE